MLFFRYILCKEGATEILKREQPWMYCTAYSRILPVGILLLLFSYYTWGSAPPPPITGQTDRQTIGQTDRQVHLPKQEETEELCGLMGKY
jgi:hypothetical protein